MIIGNKSFAFGEGHAYVMGILNVTPDSFSDGGLFLDPERALDRALKMEEEGADLIDVGAESTRPGAGPVSEDEEKRRLLPALKKIVPRLRVPVSVDTRNPSVAEAALSEGAAMVNDVSALGADGMAETVARRNVPVVLMHMRGVPETMQNDPRYDDVVREVSSFLEGRMRFAMERGVERRKILVDPGFGFGKRFEDNLALLASLDKFRALGAPVVVGVSRKSFLRRLFGEGEEDLRAANAAASSLAVRAGASVVRSHDVAVSKAAIRLALGVQPL